MDRAGPQPWNMKQLLVEALALPCLSWVCFSYSVVCSTSLLAATTACTASRLVDRTTLCKKQNPAGAGQVRAGEGEGRQNKVEQGRAIGSTDLAQRRKRRRG